MHAALHVFYWGYRHTYYTGLAVLVFRSKCNAIRLMRERYTIVPSITRTICISRICIMWYYTRTFPADLYSMYYQTQ